MYAFHRSGYRLSNLLIMSVKRKQTWDNYKEKVANKRGGKGEKKTAGPSGVDGGITVQRLLANVEGKYQKYSRIGPLTLVPLDKESTLENIKDACKSHFGTSLDCDVLAGERGPSFTDAAQIKNWKVIHVRFIESIEVFASKASDLRSHKSEPNKKSPRKRIAGMQGSSSPQVFQGLCHSAKC